jgi:hypothetical protein
MVFFDLLEVIAFLFIVLILWTQVFTPIKNKTPLFPYFRRKKLTSKLEEINDQKAEVEIEQTIEHSQKELDEEKTRLEEEKAANKRKKK